MQGWATPIETKKLFYDDRLILVVVSGIDSIIHDNLYYFKIGRPPYLPDLKEGAYPFGG